MVKNGSIELEVHFFERATRQVLPMIRLEKEPAPRGIVAVHFAERGYWSITSERSGRSLLIVDSRAAAARLLRRMAAEYAGDYGTELDELRQLMHAGLPAERHQFAALEAFVVAAEAEGHEYEVRRRLRFPLERMKAALAQ